MISVYSFIASFLFYKHSDKKDEFVILMVEIIKASPRILLVPCLTLFCFRNNSRKILLLVDAIQPHL